MMKRYIITGIIIIIIGLGILAVRFRGGEDNWICQDGEWVKHGNPRAEKPTVPCRNNTAINVGENSQPAGEANIVVFDPKESANVSSPFDIEGKARVFENVVSIRLKDKNGKILFQGTTNAQSPDVGQFGLFQKEVTFETMQKEGTLEVYQASARDGSEIDKVTIPVKFQGNQDDEDNEKEV